MHNRFCEPVFFAGSHTTPLKMVLPSNRVSPVRWVKCATLAALIGHIRLVHFTSLPPLLLLLFFITLEPRIERYTRL